MKTKWVRLSVFGCELILAFVLAGGLSAQQAPTAGSPQGQAVPHLVKFSGAVKDADGKARTGVTGITFALYEDQAGGAALWLEMQNVTLDAQGRYTVLLGASTADGMPLEVFAANEARWLGVQPEGLPEYRILLVSVPYALKAAEAETLGGMPASSFVLAAPVATGSSGNSGSQTAGSGANNVNPGAVANTSTGTANYLPVFTSNAGDMGNSILYQQAATNYLGIETANPQYNFQLVVPGEDWLWGGFALVPAFSGGSNWNTLYGNGGSGFSLIGTAKNKGYPNSRLDMGGNATINFQTGDGSAAPTSKMFVTAAGNVGIGTTNPQRMLDVNGNFMVDGSGNVTVSGNIAQVSSASSSFTGNVSFNGNTSVQGSANVFGTLEAHNGIDSNSVSAYSGNQLQLCGVSVGGAPNVHVCGGLGMDGVLTAGSAQINGTLSAQNLNVSGTKNFKIDDPLDPANKYLYHASIESSEVMNLYTGTALLDKRGEAWVQLPNWFEALNGNFRYQLTAIGAPAPKLHIAQEISGNRFKIAGGKRGLKVSWQVAGIRQDAYIQAHPMQVEVEKTGSERRTYLHPELFERPQFAQK